MSVWLPIAAATTTASTHLLRLGKLSLERVRLDKRHVGTSFRMPVFSGRVEAHQIPGNQLEILQAQGSGAAHVLGTRLLWNFDGFLGPPFTE